MTSAAGRSKAAGLLWSVHCLFLLPLCVGVVGLILFVMLFLVSFLDKKKQSLRETESLLLYFHFCIYLHFQSKPFMNL